MLSNGETRLLTAMAPLEPKPEAPLFLPPAAAALCWRSIEGLDPTAETCSSSAVVGFKRTKLTFALAHQGLRWTILSFVFLPLDTKLGLRLSTSAIMRPCTWLGKVLLETTSRSRTYGKEKKKLKF